jgi:hypothetical protein
MKFLYRYYYTFFSLHLKDNQTSKNKSPAWLSTLIQVRFGIGALVLNIVMIVSTLFGGQFVNRIQPNKFVVGLIVFIIPTTILYYLLYDYYGVSKQSGLTPNDNFVVTPRTKAFFWMFWIVSLFGLLILGRLIKTSGFNFN